MKKLLSIISALLFLFSFSVINAQDTYITLDTVHCSGFYPPNYLVADADIELALKYVNYTECRQSPTNGFRIYTSDGAVWSGFEGVCVDDEICNTDDFIIQYPFPDGNDGPPMDRVGFGGITMFGTGWVSPYSGIAAKICFHTGTTIGSHITLDSTSFTGFNWVWAQVACNYGTPTNIVPDWGGPYEFEIIEPPTCCQGEWRGDANCSSGEADISDITRLVDHLYLDHGELCCFDEADVNDDDEVDIADITCIIQDLYLFTPCIQPCPGYVGEPYGTVDGHTGCKNMEKSADSLFWSDDCLEYSYDGSGTLTITRISAGYNCCVDELGANISFDGGTITFDEYEVNPACYCLCLYDVEYTLHNIEPGTYTLLFNELYLESYDTPLEVTIDLISEPEGSFCLERDHYPWVY